MKLVAGLFFAVIVALLPIWPYSAGSGSGPSAWASLMGFVVLALHWLRAI